MPRKSLTLRDYARRIDRVVAWLAAHPGREPRLEELAAIAAFSPCHFHRIYRLLTGETPAETMARQRLQLAAASLLKTRQGIAGIAAQAGYGSVAAFTRAFRATYGLPPAAYRRRGGLTPFLRPITTPMTETMMFEVTQRDLPPLRLAALPHQGPYDRIGERFDALTALGTGHALLGPETEWFGLYYDDPHSVKPAELRSAAGFTLPPGAEPPAPATLLTLPAQRVAVLRFQGPYAELEGAYTWLYRDWLPQSGEEPADAPCLERYLNDCRSLPPAEWLTEILLPLQR
ncbi:GyrI-like domain-containing protein [Pseudoroseomonas cervicalis]|uniref:AraC family transcriptional regulator n=1 Tax=Teichococcus cervicalis TaxID=204525 RepID=UPI00278B3003|nr:AraC family transcriptional regulator [Pseudoroseomonas cervicalis]MDQ1080127.1 AraC family transcriptional regulator [Pseudoroseomonas cervicalis]